MPTYYINTKHRIYLQKLPDYSLFLILLSINNLQFYITKFQCIRILTEKLAQFSNHIKFIAIQ